MPADHDPLRDELAAIDEEVERTPTPRRSPRILSMSIAAVALASFGAVTWYAYNQGVRMGSEDAAPLLKPAGPAKVAPLTPGGLEVPDRDKYVYSRLDEGADDRQIERLLPPPEAPLPPPGTGKTKAAAPAGGKTAAKSAAAKTAEPPLPSPKLAPPPPPPTASSPSSSAGAAKLAKLPEPPPPPKTAGESDTPDRKAKPDSKGPARAIIDAPTRKTSSERPPKTSAPEGSYRIQIGAMRSRSAAKRAWEAQASRHKDLLGGLSLHIQAVTITGKGRFYRVQAGPIRDAASARRLCAALKQRKVGCIIVRP